MTRSFTESRRFREVPTVTLWQGKFWFFRHVLLWEVVAWKRWSHMEVSLYSLPYLYLLEEHTNSQCNQLPVSLLDQLLKRWTSIAEIVDWNHVQTRLFFQAFFSALRKVAYITGMIFQVLKFSLFAYFKWKTWQAFFNWHERFFLYNENLWMKPCSYRLIRRAKHSDVSFVIY